MKEHEVYEAKIKNNSEREYELQDTNKHKNVKIKKQG